MPEESLDRLRPHLQFVSLPQGFIVKHVDGPIEFLYFVNRGFVSLVKTMRDGRAVEVGGVGIEGVTSPNALFGSDHAVFDGIVQIPGQAFRLSRETLKAEVARDPPLRVLLEDYARFLLGQIGQTAACNRLHSVEQRCCRWLLVAHDNARADRFFLTHEFLAMMLGAQRSGVSLAARALKDDGLIDYDRGVVTILDRHGLEHAACECYDTTRSEMTTLFDRFGDESSRQGDESGDRGQDATD